MPDDATDDDDIRGSRRSLLADGNVASTDPEQAITAHDTAQLIGIADITLAQWRGRGEGPRWFKVGKRNIRYRLADVLAYRAARMVGAR